MAAVNITVRLGANINFTASIIGTTTPTYSWAGPNSYTANVQNPSIAGEGTLNIGTYSLTINSSGCIQTATTQVSAVNALPTVAVNSGSICSVNNFIIIPSGASTYTIQGGSANVTPTANASYTVIGSSTAGCVSANTATSNVTVNTNPTVTAASSNTSFICVGSSATLTATGASNYVWNTTAVIEVSLNTTTSYAVTGTGKVKR